MTLMVGPEICLLHSHPDASGEGRHSTACRWDSLRAGAVDMVEFTVLGLQPGEHTLTFKLRTMRGRGDIVEKKLRVAVR